MRTRVPHTRFLTPLEIFHTVLNNYLSNFWILQQYQRICFKYLLANQTLPQFRMSSPEVWSVLGNGIFREFKCFLFVAFRAVRGLVV